MSIDHSAYSWKFGHKSDGVFVEILPIVCLVDSFVVGFEEKAVLLHIK